MRSPSRYDAHLSYPDPAIDEVRGQVAVERGPLVLALESVDLPGETSMDSVRIDAGAAVVTTPTGARVEIVAPASEPRTWAYTADAGDLRHPAKRGTAELIPYYRWGSRGPSTMRVFTPLA